MTKTILFGIVLALLALSGFTIWELMEKNSALKREQAALEEKIKAEGQSKLAIAKKHDAEINLKLAEEQKAEADRRRKLAEISARDIKLQKLRAKKASLEANQARKKAQLKTQNALKQKDISDSLRVIAEISAKNAYRLRMLSIAQAIAIKSRLAQKGSYDDTVRQLLALQASKFHEANKGKYFDKEIMHALLSAYLLNAEKKYYIHNFHAAEVKSIAINPKSDQIASVSPDGQLIIVSGAEPGKVLKTFLKQNLLLEQLAYSPDGSQLVSASDGKLYIFDSDNELKAPTAYKVHEDKITDLLWTEDRIFSTGLDGKLVLSNRSKGILKSWKMDSKPLCICKSTNMILIGCEDGSVYGLNMQKSDKPELLKSFKQRITAIAGGRLNNNVLVGTAEGKLYLLNIAVGSETLVHVHGAGISQVTFNEKNGVIASASLDGTVKLWYTGGLIHVFFGSEEPLLLNEHTGWVLDLAFSPDGIRLVSCGKDKKVITYTVSQITLEKQIAEKLNRNLSRLEWQAYIGVDIPYEKTISGLE